jgi:hypothetical protein
MAESNETIVSLNQVRDLYGDHIKIGVCAELIDMYDKISRQLYKLTVAWDGFKSRNRKTLNDTSRATD